MKKIKQAVSKKSLYKFLKQSVIYIYWKFRRTHTLEIGDYSAIFDGDIDRGGARNRRRFPREKAHIHYLINQAQPTDTIYDVGANTGLYTCFLSQLVPDGQVIAFEPYSPNVRQLRQNISYNRGNAQIFELALSNEHGEVALDVPQTDEVGFGNVSVGACDSESSVTAQAAPADDLIEDEKIPTPNVVKIDVEGSEMRVIEGMKKALASRKCRVLLCEVHHEIPSQDRPSIYDFDSSPKELSDAISDLGFDKINRTEADDAVYIRAEK